MAQLTLKYHPIAYLPFSLATPVAIKVAGEVDSIFSVHWFIGQTSWVKGSGFPQAPRSVSAKSVADRVGSDPTGVPLGAANERRLTTHLPQSPAFRHISLLST